MDGPWHNFTMPLFLMYIYPNEHGPNRLPCLPSKCTSLCSTFSKANSCFTMCFAFDLLVVVAVANLSLCESTVNGLCTAQRRLIQGLVDDIIPSTVFQIPFDNATPLCFGANITLSVSAVKCEWTYPLVRAYPG